MENIIKATQCWLDSVIIEHNICPFAKQERDKGRIRFFVSQAEEMSQMLEQLVLEWERLDEQPEIETTLFMLAHIGHDFNEYLDILEIANQLLIEQDCEGIYQLASFHPNYCFAGSDDEDPANYTNRSPYPTLHIIREKSLEQALQNYPEPELIPVRNIEYCQTLGLEKMQQMLAKCMTD
ncbi:DUF1415 domain-containing protein [sulfur-oxidizing endosymbiont of Gigantopelta aegis]|uniref:DUF1415 domain-containing protein n=1 Tax=sulfur-oxidizing endosymbiont of Gigantopelta aegis TaxID=2794934 RepID=UPI0018DC9563|nr:DUF1415 domain-containing protein [sulfur-oxidizing endosymbiont of Gigantopelta aegis]